MEEGKTMKFSKLIISLFVLTTTLSTLSIPIGVLGEETGYTSPLNFFQIGGDTNFTAYVVAPLSWELNKPVNLTLYINVTVLPEGSNMTIVSLSYSYNLPNSPYPIYQTPSTPNEMITEANQQVVDRKILRAPSDVEEFNITIKIIANSSSSPENQEFEMEFPGDLPYIEVEDTSANPIINLPGFPESRTFWRWILIFFVAMIIMTLPASYVAFMKIQQNLKSRKKKGAKKK